jgi:HEAT repeat protein
MLPRYVALIPLIVLTALCRSAGAVEADTETDEETLRAARLSVDGPSLLTLFRKRTPDAETQAHVKTLIAQLGSASYLEREEASEEVAGSGVAATGLLRQALSHSDLEIRRRAREALAFIEQGDLPEEVLISALRVLARRKPPRMTEVLLTYSPHAASAEITEALCLTLSAVAVREGEADPLLVRALSAKSPLQRGVAAAALCRAGCGKQLPALRRLLLDPDPHVRRRIALALLETRDKAAVPVLIDLLAKLPLEEAEQVEALLLQIAGDTPPKGELHENAKRGSYRDAWAEWWRRHGDAIDLGKIELAPHWRGYTLAICMTALRGRGARMGCILEMDARGRTRWQMQGLSSPVDAQVIDERRVLVTEYRSGQVTERNHNGDILRRIDVSDTPLEARRLPNGDTLITTRSRVFEVDRNDKEVWSANNTGGRVILSACRLPGGQIGICYQTGELERQDRSGKVLASFQVGRIFRPTGSHIQGLPNGHILVPLYYDSKVVEYDGNGREVWSVDFARPASAQRLPNGRTLVAGYGSNVIVELDRNGREVKSQQCDGRLMGVYGR